MAEALSKGGPGDEEPKPRSHPGFYTGNDPIDWAANLAACWRYIASGIVEAGHQDVKANELAKLDKEAGMLEVLVERARRASP